MKLYWYITRKLVLPAAALAEICHIVTYRAL